MNSKSPRIELPYPSGISPDLEAARAHTLRWVMNRGLVTDAGALRAFDQGLFSSLAARAHPNARGADLKLMNDWLAWFFIFDDLFDGPLGRDVEAVSAIVDEYVSLLQAETPQRHPSSPASLSYAFGELWERLSVGMSAAWRARYTRNFGNYLRALQREAQDRLQGVPGNLASYLDNRRDSIGVPTSLDCSERADHSELSPTLYDSEPMTSMRLLCAEIVLITNDIFSAPKEAAGAQMHNLVLLRMRDDPCDLPAAEAWAEGLLKEKVRDFEQAERRMRQGVQDEAEWGNIDRYITGMKNWMRATLDWSYESPRYPSAESVRF
jgi:hypothetical protein